MFAWAIVAVTASVLLLMGWRWPEVRGFAWAIGFGLTASILINGTEAALRSLI